MANWGWPLLWTAKPLTGHGIPFLKLLLPSTDRSGGDIKGNIASIMMSLLGEVASCEFYCFIIEFLEIPRGTWHHAWVFPGSDHPEPFGGKQIDR